MIAPPFSQAALDTGWTSGRMSEKVCNLGRSLSCTGVRKWYHTQQCSLQIWAIIKHRITSSPLVPDLADIVMRHASLRLPPFCSLLALPRVSLLVELRSCPCLARVKDFPLELRIFECALWFGFNTSCSSTVRLVSIRLFECSSSAVYAT